MIALLQEKYAVIEKTPQLFKIKREADQLIDTLHFIASMSNFITLSQISCTDWIEEGVFTLNYILTPDKRDKNLMIEVSISREAAALPTLMRLFPQAEVMERDIHEMFGIAFEGNPTLYDFALEDWKEIPPLRRDFDTLEYVNSHFEFKSGREDNKDVKEEIKRRKAEAKKVKDADQQ